jgi:hypothetical protein
MDDDTYSACRARMTGMGRPRARVSQRLGRDLASTAIPMAALDQ